MDQSLSQNPQYCRKQKSLGVLCTNFLSLYNRDGVETLELGDAERKLGVARRRIYDVINVLESLGFLVKKGKKEYYCRGFSGMEKKLNRLKASGGNEEDAQSFGSSYASGQEDASTGSPHHNSTLFSKQENKKEGTLGQLTENFLKLFLRSENELYSLIEAAQILLGDCGNQPHIPGNSKAKVRRLYDIANVLLSINLIEKTYVDSGKPAFRWLGLDGSLMSKKRAFGTEITNTVKKNRADILVDESRDQKDESQRRIKCEDLTTEMNQNKFHQSQQSKRASQGVLFGPFSPAGLLKDNNTTKKTVESSQDWERLASSYRPQYQNQALADIFSHYMEAWRSWYVEVTGKEPIRLL
ncbi:E2F transcription factor-like E2FE [Ranunculus cassubicifolius]